MVKTKNIFQSILSSDQQQLLKASNLSYKFDCVIQINLISPHKDVAKDPWPCEEKELRGCI